MKKYKIPNKITEITEKDDILYYEIKTLEKEGNDWIVKTALTPLEELKYCQLDKKFVESCIKCIFCNEYQECSYYFKREQ